MMELNKTFKIEIARPMTIFVKRGFHIFLQNTKNTDSQQTPISKNRVRIIMPLFCKFA